MANITVLTQTADGTLTVVCHYSTPAGNNFVGVAWSAAIVGAGYNTTVLATGVGAAQNSTVDAAAILAGTLRETVTSFNVIGFSAMTTPQKQAALTALYNQVIAADQATLQTVLNFFGYTQ